MKRSGRRDGHRYHEVRYAWCPRLIKQCAAGDECDGECNECEECDGRVRLVVTGEADDINDWNGGTPGWEEVEAGACPSCGFDAWDGDQLHDLSVRSQPEEPDHD